MRPETEKQIISPELIARAKAGDQAAYTELYERTYPALYRTICAMTRDEDTAWDILQETYLRAFQNLDKLGANEAFVSWLRRIAVNETTRRMSRRMPVSFSELSGEEEDDVAEIPDLRPESQPELVIDQQETSRLVREIMADLPEQQRLIVGMRYYEDLSVKEIADLLQLAPGSVKTQLFRGRKSVEARVRELERQGVKLYGLSPIAFLVTLLRRLEPSETVGRATLARTLTEAGLSAGAKAAGTAGAGKTITAMTASQALRHGLGAKVAAGLLSVALVGGGIWGGSKLLGSEQPTAPFQPTETRMIVSAESAASAVSEETVTEPGDARPGKPGQPVDPETEAELRALLDDQKAVSPKMGHYIRALSSQYAEPMDADLNRLFLDFYGTPSGKELEALKTAHAANTVTGREWDPSWDSREWSIVTRNEADTVLTELFGINLEDYSRGNGVDLAAVLGPAWTYLPDYDCYYANLYSFPENTGLRSIQIQEILQADEGRILVNYCYADSDGLEHWNLGEEMTAALRFSEGRYQILSNQSRQTALPAPASNSMESTESAMTEPSEAPLPEKLSGNCGDDLTWRFDPDTGTLHIEGSGDMEDYCNYEEHENNKTEWDALNSRIRMIELPEGLTGIGGSAFEYCTALTNVTIPASVKTIGDSAFYGCASLTNVTIPAGVAEIGYNVFGSCGALTAIDVASGNPRYTSLDGVLFDKQWGENELDLLQYPGGKKDTSYTMPENAAHIDLSAFSNSYLTSITLSENFGDISNDISNMISYMFDDCTALTELHVASGNSKCSSIDGVLFDKDQTVLIYYPAARRNETYTVPNGVQYIGENSFMECAALKHISIPDSVTDIGYGAFWGNSSLENVTIPGSVNRVGDYAFKCCTALKRVEFQEGVTEIGFGVFDECTALTEVTVPASVTRLGGEDWGCSYAFHGCASLTNIQVAPGNQNFSSADGVLFDKNQETLYRYPARKQGASYVIPDGVKTIDVRAFEGCAFLTDVTIPDSVTYIGVLAFADCNMLTHVTIPAGVTTIDYEAFRDCTALTEVTIPDSVTNIRKEAFVGCASLKSVTIPASVTEIGEYSFGYSDIQWSYNFESVQAASKVEGFTIYGEAGSEAQRYAEENGFIFKAV